MGVVIVICGFITSWILIFVYAWSRIIKSMNRDIEVALDREEHKKKMADMKKKHNEMTKRWSGLK